MQDSKFWRFAALLMIAVLLYVGHGLHSGGDRMPSLINTAHAGGVALAFDGPAIFTASADGTTLFTWKRDARGVVKFTGQASVLNDFGKPK